VWAWGSNHLGQLGDGTTTGRSTPVQVSNLVGVVAIAVGEIHNLALKADGTVWTWGYNYSGQLGDGTTTNRSTPVQVSNLSGVVAIAAAFLHSLAVKSDGTVWAWGWNWKGQLGDGTLADSYTPVQVSNLSGAFGVAASQYDSFAVLADGSVWDWGGNDYTLSSAPVQVQNLSAVVSIAGGKSHSLALKSGGTAWAWGSNAAGQLGDGTKIDNFHPPVRVQTCKLWQTVAVAAGGVSSLALAPPEPRIVNIDHFFLDVNSVPVVGVAVDLIVVAQDGCNNKLADYSGTVHFSLGAPDEVETVRADETFKPSDGGTLSTSVWLGVTSGIKTIIVYDIAHPEVNGSIRVDLSPGLPSSLVFTSPVQTLAPGGCYAFPTLELTDRYGNPANQGWIGTLISSSPAAAFYWDSACTVPGGNSFLKPLAIGPLELTVKYSFRWFDVGYYHEYTLTASQTEMVDMNLDLDRPQRPLRLDSPLLPALAPALTPSTHSALANRFAAAGAALPARDFSFYRIDAPSAACHDEKPDKSKSEAASPERGDENTSSYWRVETKASKFRLCNADPSQ